MNRSTPSRLMILSLMLVGLSWLISIPLNPAFSSIDLSKAAVAPGTNSKRVGAEEIVEQRSTPKPVHTKVKGRVRLRPGESAVLTYIDAEAGMNGVVLVTPQMVGDGLFALSTRILNGADSEIGSALNNLMPHPLEYERTTAVTDGEFAAIFRPLDGKLTSYPRCVTRSGADVRIASMVKGADGAPQSGFELEVTPRSIGGMYDLELQLDKYHGGDGEN